MTKYLGTRAWLILLGTSFPLLAVVGCLGTESGNPPKVEASLKIQAITSNPDLVSIDGSPSEVVVEVARLGIDQITFSSCAAEEVELPVEATVDLIAGHEFNVPGSLCSVEVKVAAHDLDWRAVRPTSASDLSFGLLARTPVTFTVEDDSSETLLFDFDESVDLVVTLDVAQLLNLEEVRAASPNDVLGSNGFSGAAQLSRVTQSGALEFIAGPTEPPPCERLEALGSTCAPSATELGLFWVLATGDSPSCTDVCEAGGLECRDSVSVDNNRISGFAQFDEVLASLGSEPLACRPGEEMGCKTTNGAYLLEPGPSATRECHQPGESGFDRVLDSLVSVPQPFSCDAGPEALDCVDGHPFQFFETELLCPCTEVP